MDGDYTDRRNDPDTRDRIDELREDIYREVRGMRKDLKGFMKGAMVAFAFIGVTSIIALALFGFQANAVTDSRQDASRAACNIRNDQNQGIRDVLTQYIPVRVPDYILNKFPITLDCNKYAKEAVK